MLPSSRTPEGSPNRCPVCGNQVRIEPSTPPGDAPCPCCGHLLWFSPTSLPLPTRRRSSRSVPPPTPVAVAYSVSTVACAGVLSGNGGFSWVVWLGIALVFGHYVLPLLAGTARNFWDAEDYRTLNQTTGWGILLGPMVGSLCGVVVPLPITPFQGGIIGLATGSVLFSTICITLILPVRLLADSWHRLSIRCRRLPRR